MIAAGRDPVYGWQTVKAACPSIRGERAIGRGPCLFLALVPTFFLSCALVFGLATGISAEQSREEPPASGPPPIACPYTKEAIIDDGLFTETAWTLAPSIPVAFVFKPVNPRREPPQTFARILWSDSALHVAFECRDDDVWSFSAKPDDTLWLGDAVEFFVRPADGKGFYWEFVVAPNGALADARYPSRGAGGFHRFKDWNSGARVAVAVEGTDGRWEDEDLGYRMEMSIPWDAFAPFERPHGGEVWNFGFFRCDVSKSYEDPFLLMATPGAGAWGFHDYDRYLSIRFAPPEE